MLEREALLAFAIASLDGRGKPNVITFPARWECRAETERKSGLRDLCDSWAVSTGIGGFAEDRPFAQDASGCTILF
jgi:hypothetical protein